MPPADEPNPSTRIGGAVAAPGLLILAALLFAVMAVLAKAVAKTVPGPEIAFVRFCIGLLACGSAHLRAPLRARNKFGLLLRGAYGGAAVLLYFSAIARLPVGIATLLNYTAPVFTALYAALFLGEAVTRATLLALGVTTFGVALVVKGSMPATGLGFGIWPFVGVASAVLSGAAVATIREVRQTDGAWEVFAALCVGGIIINALPALLSWVTPSPSDWIVLLGVGLLSVVAQVLMTYALRFVRAATAGVIAQLTPVAALFLGFMLYRELVPGLALVGAALTLSGVALGVYSASSSEPRAFPDS